MIARRGFLIGLGGLAVVVGGIALRMVTATDRDGIIAVIRKRLTYLRLDEAGLQRFATDAAANLHLSSLRLRLVTLAGPLYTKPALSGHNAFKDAIRNGEERIVTLYLLSSDFFQYGADETRVVQYVEYYDPVGHACGNPFSRSASSPV